MIDRFGRIIQQDGIRYWTDGIEIEAENDEKALSTFNAMAPGDWVEPTEDSQ